MFLVDSGGLLIGVDLQKDQNVIEAAYNDKAGVTAEFNLNLLAHINRETGANFDLSRWRHRAIYNAEAGRIEMYLISATDQTVRIQDREFRFRAGEKILTEHSYRPRQRVSSPSLARPDLISSNCGPTTRVCLAFSTL